MREHEAIGSGDDPYYLERGAEVQREVMITAVDFFPVRLPGRCGQLRGCRKVTLKVREGIEKHQAHSRQTAPAIGTKSRKWSALAELTQREAIQSCHSSPLPWKTLRSILPLTASERPEPEYCQNSHFRPGYRSDGCVATERSQKG